MKKGGDIMSTQREMAAADNQAQIFLQPVAAPSILGFFGLAAAVFILGAYWGNWFGDSTTAYLVFPFIAFVGGLAQFLAGMWAYRARDGVATALHGIWGAFFMAYGLLFLLAATGAIVIPNGSFVAMGYWFLAMAGITWTITAAAFAESGMMGIVSFVLALATSFLAVGSLIGNGVLLGIGGWAFIVAAVFAWYTAAALMVDTAYGRRVLPVIKFGPARMNRPMNAGYGEPGVVPGQ
jgi:succinate-acetate transporter protein